MTATNVVGYENRDHNIAHFLNFRFLFPFSDPLLKDLGIRRPEKTASYSFDNSISFPQLGLAGEANNKLREEFMDHHWIFLL